MRRIRGCALAMAVVLSGATQGIGAVLRVPEDYATLLAGVDAAASGDTVLVGSGTYTATAVRSVVINGQALALEAAAFLRPGITVVSEGGATAPVIDGGGTGRAFVLGETSGLDSVLVSGFQVTGSTGFVVSHASPLEIRDCSIADCDFGALSSSSGSLVTLRDCVIERNETARSSAQFGAFYSLNSTLELYDCVIQDNNQRGIYATGGGRLVMERCYVSGHSLVIDGGAGVRAKQVPDVQIRNSWFVENKSVNGGAISTSNGSIGVIEFCVFLRDSSSNAGGGVSIGSAVRVTNNTFVACDAVLGSALDVPQDFAGVDRNIIAYCTAQYGAIMAGPPGPKPISGCNLFWQNSGGDFSTFGYWTASPTDVFADPQFCDFPLDDFTLRTSSPAAAPNQPVCGQIGAFGTACGPVSLQERSWGDIKGSYR